MKKSMILVGLVFLSSFLFNAGTMAQIDLQKAAKYFNDAQSQILKDGGKFWGFDLSGNFVFVDPKSNTGVANNPVPVEGWKELDGLHYGELTDGMIISNTAFKWNGEDWSVVIFDHLSENEKERNDLIIHELFHQHEEKLNLYDSGANADHLNSLNGRVLLYLEWNALLLACESEGKARQSAIDDAVDFRKTRKELFPGDFIHEISNELHEGLAELTGMILCDYTDEEYLAKLKEKVTGRAGGNSISWTFAYTSGPLYGYLLEKKSPNWKKELAKGSDLGLELAKHYNLNYKNLTEIEIQKKGALYGYDSIMPVEQARVQWVDSLNHVFTEKYLNKPSLFLPNHSLNIQFNPQEIVPFGEVGSVYRVLKAQAQWGELEVLNGEALLLNGWKGLKISFDTDCTPSGDTHNSEFKLTINEGYQFEEYEGGWKLVKI